MAQRGRKSAASLSTIQPAPLRIVAAIADPPRPLGKAGRSIWDRMVSSYDFSSPAGAEILAQACQSADLAEATEDQKLELQCRALVARLLGRLCE